MIEIRRLALCGALALALSACGKEGSEDEAGQAAPAPATTQPATPAAQKPAVQTSLPPATAIQSVNVAADAVTVGAALKGDLVVKAAHTQFTLADTVYASASVRGKAPGTEVHVYWTYVKEGTTLKEETKKLAGGEQNVWFSFAKADGMKPGKYNVEIDVNMVPVGITDFEIR